MLGVKGPQEKEQNKLKRKGKEKKSYRDHSLGTYSESLFHNRRHLIRGCPAWEVPRESNERGRTATEEEGRSQWS